ncbi:MAG: hypothetical protein ACSHXD_05975 [Marinosulfonomonas sp.]
MFVFKHQQFFHDDAFISLRYARNLAEHGELTWNFGEYVEGYTNFLYVLISAVPIKFGIDPTYAVQIINLAAAISMLIMQVYASRLILPGSQARLARASIVVATAATPAIAIWVMGGLEAVVVSTFATAGLLALLPIAGKAAAPRNILWAALAFSLAVLTRLDIAVFIAGAGAGLLMGGTGTFQKRLLPAVIVVGVPALVSFAHMGWRYTYYGDILPLTFYAKTDVEFLVRLKFLPEFVSMSLPSVGMLAVAFLTSIWAIVRRQTSPHFWLLFLPIALQSAYVVWSGADHMPAARVLVPVMPAAGLLLLASMKNTPPKLASFICVAATVITLFGGITKPPQAMDPAGDIGRVVGLYIKKTWPEDSTVALHTAGSTPYFATSMTFIDMLGLNDPTIAKRRNVPILAPWQSVPGHGKGDGKYVMDRKPDYIIGGPATGTDFATDYPWFLSDIELPQIDGFYDCYALVTETIEIEDTQPWRGRKQPKPLLFKYYQKICD